MTLIQKKLHWRMNRSSFSLFSFNFSINFTFVAVKQTKITPEEDDIFADSSLNKKPAPTTKTNDKKQEEVSSVTFLYVHCIGISA